MAELLDIVDENDVIIGQADRDAVHEKGLICRMVFILFYTPDKKIILQRRGKNKEMSPGKLTVTVSGHVSSGESYDDTAVKEALEETGIQVNPDALQHLGVSHAGYEDNGYITNAMRSMYLYQFEGDASDLKTEAGEGEGFELLSLEEFWRRRGESPEEFSTFLVHELGTQMIQAVEAA